MGISMEAVVVNRFLVKRFLIMMALLLVDSGFSAMLFHVMFSTGSAGAILSNKSMFSYVLSPPLHRS